VPTELAKAYVQIIPSAEGIKGKLTEALGGESEQAGRSAGGLFASGMQTTAKVGLAAIGTTMTAALGAGNLVRQGVGDLAAYGDNIDKMSQKMNLSAQAYQEWDFIMQHNGTSIDSLQAGMKTLANAAESNNKAFERLGISQEQIAGMSNEELFSAAITALQNVESETERTYLAGQLLGRGATELGPLLNMSAEETEAMRQQVHELGGVMSDDAVKAAAAYQDSLQNLQTGFDGLKRGMLADFLPSAVTVMDGLTALLSGDETGIDQMQQGVSEFANHLLELVPKVVEIGAPILESLAGAILDNLPLLIDTGIELVGTLGGALMDNLPQIASVGLQALTTFAGGIGDNLPELIPAVVDVLLQMVITLTDPENISMLADAAVQLLVGLGVGLVNAIPVLIENIPTIIFNIVDSFLGYDWGSVGWNIITGIADGVINAIPNLLGAVGNAASSALNRVTSFLGIHSPSTVFADRVGKFIPAGIAEGVTQNLSPINTAMDQAARATVTGISPAMLRSAGRSAGAEYTRQGGGGSPDATLQTILELLVRYIPELAERSIVLDDGTLVGKLSPGIDAELGQIQQRRRRG
jgi:hypothetical protein